MDVFVSSVAGHVVGRLGTGTATQKDAQIGCRFDPDYGEIVWDEDEVVKLPEPHYLENQRYYDKAIARGALKERSRSDWEAWQRGTKTRADAEQKAAEEARAKELEEGRKAAEVEARKEAEHQKDRRERLLEAKRRMDELKNRDSKKPEPPSPEPEPPPPPPEPDENSDIANSREAASAMQPRKVSKRSNR